MNWYCSEQVQDIAADNKKWAVTSMGQLHLHNYLGRINSWDIYFAKSHVFVAFNKVTDKF